MSRNLSSSQFSEVPLFNPGKEQDARPYYHFDSTAEEGAREPWNPAVGPMHFGTAQAAMDRAKQVRTSYGTSGDPVSGSVHVGRLKPRRPLANTRDTPMSDDMANVLSDLSSEREAWEGATGELATTAGLDHDAAVDHLEYESFNFRAKRGGYYRNDAEDIGSISMVLNRPDRDLQHLGTVGFEPEHRREVLSPAPDPITGQETNAVYTEVRRGAENIHDWREPPKEVLGPQFNWQQTELRT